MSSDRNEVNEIDGSSKRELIGKRNEIVAAISRFYNNENMSDIVLKLGAQQFHAHRFVLVLMSDVFQTMCSKRWDPSKVNEIELNESEQCIPVFPSFLQFLYQGQILVDTTTALPLLMLADKYNVQPLKTSCEEYVQRQVKQGNVVGAIRWLPYLQLCGHFDLEKSCVEVIVIEMDYILGCDDFLLLNIDLLVLLLDRNDLVVSCEYALYEGTLRWLSQLDDSDPNYENCIKTLIPLIRFSMMFPAQLLEIELSDFYQKRHTFIGPYLSLAHRFRSLAPEVSDDTFTGNIYRPRNYTNPVWCHLLHLDADNVSFHNKCTNLQSIHDLVISSSMPRETTWQIQIVRGDKKDDFLPGGMLAGKVLSSPDGGLFHAHMPKRSVFQTSSSTLPLRMSICPLKPIRPNIAVDVSLFLVRKNTVSKHLDTKTLLSSESGTKDGSVRSPKRYCASLNDKIFQPSPMHFSFTPPQAAKEPEVVLKYQFARDELDSPPEVPCVTFGPNFAHPPRPLHSIRVAIIVKPRLKSSSDLEHTHQAEGSGSLEESLPLLG
ncbi:unnamed protein product [Clavelina lepadiformis]|uniref:BTB domain-containing protein n=1 Tax=Clavelina lepadiformis TaxID=159417 RepID=A0ABP0GXF5_CLALP